MLITQTPLRISLLGGGTDLKEFYEFEEKIKKVKLSDVKELAEKVKGDYSFFALVPK